MPWIESHSTLIEHRKVRQAAFDLNIEPVHFMGHLHAFWHKVIELAEDGDITLWTEHDISYYARWSGDEKKFYQAMLNRFIDEKEVKKGISGEKKVIRTVHDWLDYAGIYLYRKYHTSNPKHLKDIKKKHNKLGYPKGKPKGDSKGKPKGALPNQPTRPTKPNLPDQPNLDDCLDEIVEYLNQIVGSNFRATTKETRQLVNKRLSEGFTVNNFKTVIDNKFIDWATDKKYSAFLRPETLFGNKFEGYLNQQVKESRGTDKTKGNYALIEDRKKRREEQRLALEANND